MFSSRDLHHAPYTHKSGSFDPALGHLSLLFGTRMRRKRIPGHGMSIKPALSGFLSQSNSVVDFIQRSSALWTDLIYSQKIMKKMLNAFKASTSRLQKLAC